MASGPDIIATARLRLRPLVPADAGRLARLANDRDLARQTAKLPHPYGEADAHAFIAGLATPSLAVSRRRGCDFAVDLFGEGLVGVVGFKPEEGSQLMDLGYWLGRPYWGGGLATEAATAALAWARDSWGRRALAAGHFTDNPASGRVLEKAGFLYTGVRRPYGSVARGGLSESREMIWLA